MDHWTAEAKPRSPVPTGFLREHQIFLLSFNASLKIDFRSFCFTSDGGLILVRKLDERSRLAGNLLWLGRMA